MMLALYPFFIVFSFLMPRNKKIWVFGCRKGYLDNTKYFFEYASSQEEFNCYWLANDNEELLEVITKGYNAVLKKSLEGYWISARAGMSFICTGFTDVNRILSLKSCVVNFWHGTPIKKLYFSAERYSNENKKNKVVNFFRKKVTSFLIYSTNFYYASNSFERKVVTSSARMPFEKSLALGAPRFDAIKSSKPIKVLEKLKENNKKIYLYAPTWRDNELDSQFKLCSKNFLKLQQFLEESESILIVKPHFNTSSQQFKGIGLEASGRIIYAEDIFLDDINEIYRYIDVLITDVSSALYDFLIFNRPVVIFMPDYEKYLLSSFGIYDYFLNILSNEAVSSWDDLIRGLQNSSAGIINSVELFNDISREVSRLNTVNKSIYYDVLKRFYSA